MTQSDNPSNKMPIFTTWRRPIMLIAFAGFLVGIILSIRAQPDILTDLKLWPVFVVAMFGVPVTVALNAIEFKQSATMLGQRFGFFQSFEITIIGSVANMLPLPGGTIVRISALNVGGASVRQGTIITLMVSLLWIGVAFVYAGFWITLSQGHIWGVGGIFFGIGSAAMLACVVIAATQFDALAKFWPIIFIKIAHVLIDALRIWLCLLALGVDAQFAQASALTVTSVVGAAVSIVPAGLGVREAVAAMLAPLIMLSAASAYLSASLNRIIGLLITAPVALLLALRKRGQAV